MKQPDFDPYAALGLPHDATDEQVKSAFRRLALEHHPDRSRHPDAQVRFVRISDAHALLTAPAHRRAYDERVERERRLRVEAAAARARQEAQQQESVARELAERAQRAAAQRERARQEQTEREAQMSRVLGRAYREEPDRWDDGQPGPRPAWVAPPERSEAADIYDVRETHKERAASDDGPHGIDQPTHEPAAAEPVDAGEAAAASPWAAADRAKTAAFLLAIVISIACALWNLALGAWAAAVLSVVVLPVLLLVVGLGVFYPLAALIVAMRSLVRVPLTASSDGNGAQPRDGARVRRLMLSYSLQMACYLCGGALVAWLGMVVAPGQSQAWQEPLIYSSAAAAYILGYYALERTASLMFGLLDGRESLSRRPQARSSRYRWVRPDAEASTHVRTPKRTPRGSRNQRHASAV